MSVDTAAAELREKLSRFPWLNSVGVGGNTIYVYVTTRQPKELGELKDGYKGYPVVIEQSGRFRPLRRA